VKAQGRDWLRGRPHTLWGYSELLPVPRSTAMLSLGEGDTPLLLSEGLLRERGRRAYFKNETQNPTWSHKDRFHAVAATMARDLGYKGVVCTSTGNHGASAAAYASAAGLQSLVFYPPEMPAAFLHLTGVYGGQAAVTGWDARGFLQERVLRRPGWCPVGGRNPFGPEGYKTIAYEVVRDLGAAPDLLLVPVGSGKLILGVWKGFEDLKALGFIDSLPRLVGCQASGVDVLSGPLAQGKRRVTPRPEAYTVALSTKEPEADSRVLEALRRSGGTTVALTEAEIMDGVRRLGRQGLAAEPASVLAMLGFEHLCELGEVPRSAVSVCLLTSSLAKSPDLLPEVSWRRPWRLSADGADLDAFLATSGLEEPAD
jgi:threonine synthase